MVSSLPPTLSMSKNFENSDGSAVPPSRETAPSLSALDQIKLWMRSKVTRSPSPPRGRRQQRTLSLERLGERAMMAGDLSSLPNEPSTYISYEAGEGEGSDPAQNDALTAALTDQAILEMMLEEEHQAEMLKNRSWGSSLMIDSQNVTSAGVAPSGDTLAVGKSNGTLAFYTAGTGIEQTEKALNLGAPITSLKYLTDGNLVVTTAKSFRVIDSSGVTVKTVNYSQDISKMNTIDNGFFVFVYASAGLPSSVMLYDQKGEQTYKKDISPNVGVVSVTSDGSTMIHGYPSGASAIPITAQGKGIGLDFYQYMGRGSGTVGTAEINADGSGRFLFAYQTEYGTNLIVTDASGKTLVRSFSLGMSTAVQNMVSLGGGRFMVDTLQDVTPNAGRSRQTRIFKYELGALKEEVTATKQPGYKYSPVSVSSDMTTVVTSQYDSVVVGSLPSAVADTKALHDGAKKIGPAVISSAQLDNPLGKNLVSGQRSDLVQLAQTYSTLTTLKYNSTTVYQKFLATFADWRDENAVATAKAKNWSLDYFYYARGQEFESFNRDIGSYDDALGRMMEAGMNAVLADIRFQDPTSALTSLRAIPKDPIYGSTLAHIARIGIVLPSEQQIINACKAILIKGSDAYQDMQGVYQNRTENAVRVFNSNDYTDHVQLPPTVPDTVFDRKSWIAAMEVTAKIAELEKLSRLQPQPAGSQPLDLVSQMSPAKIVEGMKTEISALLAQGRTMESILRDIQALNGGNSLKSMEREKIQVGRDIMSKMNRASLEALKDLAEKALPSAELRSADSEITHWKVTLEATTGLLSLIPEGGTEPDFTKHPKGEIWRSYIERTSTDPVHTNVALGKIEVAKPYTKPTALEILPSSKGTITFELQADSMVNFFVDVKDVGMVGAGATGLIPMIPNFSLALTGTTADGTSVSWSNPKNGTSAETVSGRLPKGTYTLTVNNTSSEKPIGNFYKITKSAYVDFLVHPEITPFDSRKIEGRVSIEGSPVSMPVSMSVAEFLNNGDRKTSAEVAPLNSNLPITLVIHGRADNDGQTYPGTQPSNNISELTKQLKLSTGDTGQVITIDWHDAANTGVLPGSLDDARWTPTIGKWIAQQLMNQGFDASKVQLIGHSHGTYISYFTAEEMLRVGGNKVGNIISLDSAKNPPFFGPNIGEGNIVFRNVATHSTAFKSSAFGSTERVMGAERNIYVTSPSIDPFKEHGFAVTAFADMLEDQRNDPDHPISQYFSLPALNGSINNPLPSVEGYDAWISVRGIPIDTAQGTWWKAKNSSLWLRNTDGTWSNGILDPELASVDGSISPLSGEGSTLSSPR